jgi:hypothetical protein
MGHNPILKSRKIGRLESFSVPRNTVGMLYQGQRYVRTLKAGNRLTLNERIGLGNLVVYLITTTPHDLTWRVTLPTSNDSDTFSTTIYLRYRIGDPKKMVQEQVKDTETLIMRTFEPELRKITRYYPLNKHKKVDEELESYISQTHLFSLCGLELAGKPSVIINLSQEDIRKIEKLDKLRRAMQVAQMAKHSFSVPTSDRAYNLQVMVDVRYKVHNPEELPSTVLEESVEYLWPTIRSKLRRRSRRYSLMEIAQAEQAMQEELDDLVADRGIPGIGLQLLSAESCVELDEMAREQYVELAQTDHAAQLKAAQIKGLKDIKQFYDELIQRGSWAALAVAVSQDEISADELYQRLNNKEREQLEMQVNLLQNLRADDARDELHDQHISTKILENVVRSATRGPQQGDALEKPESQRQLPKDDQANEPEENE